MEVAPGAQRRRQWETVVAELTETVEIDGAPLLTAEALVFDFDDAGHIAHIGVFISKRPQVEQKA